MLTQALAEVLNPVDVLGTDLVDAFPNLRPTRVVTFDKSETANWGVPWHQDRVIAVQERHDVDGFENWSRKAGWWHCAPPADVLSDMFFVRLHLDPSTTENGAMEIAVGSHDHGLIAASKADDIASQSETEVCEAAAGDILILNMLTLHRSRPSTQTGSTRRTIRVDYAAGSLPAPLSWLALV